MRAGCELTIRFAADGNSLEFLGGAWVLHDRETGFRGLAAIDDIKLRLKGDEPR